MFFLSRPLEKDKDKFKDCVDDKSPTRKFYDACEKGDFEYVKSHLGNQDIDLTKLFNKHSCLGIALVKDNYKIFRYILNNSDRETPPAVVYPYGYGATHGESWVSTGTKSKNRAYVGTHGKDWIHIENKKTNNAFSGFYEPSPIAADETSSTTEPFETTPQPLAANEGTQIAQSDDKDREIDIHQNDNIFLSLPLELFDLIFSYLDFYEIIITIPRICTLFHFIMSNKKLSCLQKIELKPNKHFMELNSFRGMNFDCELSEEIIRFCLERFGRNMNSLSLNPHRGIHNTSHSYRGKYVIPASTIRGKNMNWVFFNLNQVRGSFLTSGDNYTQLIMEYCGDNLRELKLNQMEITVEEFADLNGIEILEIRNCKHPNLQGDPKEHQIEMNSVKKLIIHNFKFPNCSLVVPNCQEMSLTNTIFHQFSKSCVKLRSLYVELVGKFSETIVFDNAECLEELTMKKLDVSYPTLNSDVMKKIPNVHSLTFGFTLLQNPKPEQLFDGVELRNVRNLKITGAGKSETFLGRICLFFPNLETLECGVVPKTNQMTAILNVIERLKNLKMLKLPHLRVPITEFLRNYFMYPENPKLRSIEARFVIEYHRRSKYKELADLVMSNLTKMAYLMSEEEYLEMVDSCKKFLGTFHVLQRRTIRLGRWCRHSPKLFKNTILEKIEDSHPLLDKESPKELVCTKCKDCSEQLLTKHICEGNNHNQDHHRSQDYFDYLYVCPICCLEMPVSVYPEHSKIHLEKTCEDNDDLFESHDGLGWEFVSSIPLLKNLRTQKLGDMKDVLICYNCKQFVNGCLCSGSCRKSDYYDYFITCCHCKENVLYSEWYSHIAMHSKDVLRFNRKTGRANILCPLKCGFYQLDVKNYHGKTYGHLEKCKNYEIVCKGCDETMLFSEWKKHIAADECKKNVVHMLLNVREDYEFFKNELMNNELFLRFPLPVQEYNDKIYYRKTNLFKRVFKLFSKKEKKVEEKKEEEKEDEIKWGYFAKSCKKEDEPNLEVLKDVGTVNWDFGGEKGKIFLCRIRN